MNSVTMLMGPGLGQIVMEKTYVVAKNNTDGS